MFRPSRGRPHDPRMIVFIIVHREVFWGNPDCVPQVAYRSAPRSAPHSLSLFATPAPDRLSQDANNCERIRRGHDRRSAISHDAWWESSCDRIARGCLWLQEDHSNLLSSMTSAEVGGGGGTDRAFVCGCPFETGFSLSGSKRRVKRCHVSGMFDAAH